MRASCKVIVGENTTPHNRRSGAVEKVHNKAYLFGGISHSLLNDTNIFDFSKLSWTKEEIKEAEEESAAVDDNTEDLPQYAIDLQGKIVNPLPDGRFGHTLCKYRNILVLYGGEYKYNTLQHKRDLFNDVYFYHVAGNIWEKIPWREKILYGRKYHTATMIGKHMFVHGGVNPNSHVIDEPVIFDVSTSKWRDVTILKNSLGCLAGHTIVKVFYLERKFQESQMSMKSLPKISKSKINKKVIKEEGLYCYGGMNENGECSSNLYFLKMKTPPYLWEKVNHKGKCPEPRYFHSLDYMADLYSLVLFGGRRVIKGTIGTYSKSGYYFSDFWLFHIPSSHWCQVQIRNIAL